MNVRVFLLIAMTGLFGLLWSSDQHYQQAQAMAAVAAEAASAQASTTGPLSNSSPAGYTNSSDETSLSVRTWRASIERQSIARPTLDPKVAGGIADFLAWGSRLGARIEEESCWLQYRIRRDLFFAERRMTRLMGTPPIDWREVAEKISGQPEWIIEVPSKSAHVEPLRTNPLN